MKTFVKTIFAAAILFASSSAGAEPGRETVALKLPPGFAAKTCPSPVWKGTRVLWKGVKDARSEPEIGRQSKRKGRDVILVDSNPPVETVVDAALREIFPVCGVTLTPEGNEDVAMSAEVAEFYAGVEKKFLTGKGMAKSRIVFQLKRRNSNVDQTVEVGYEMEAKKIRQKDLRQLEATLNELLARTIEQIPKLDGFKDL